jgi:hypothetical protein
VAWLSASDDQLDCHDPMMYRSLDAGQRAFGQVFDPNGHNR